MDGRVVDLELRLKLDSVARLVYRGVPEHHLNEYAFDLINRGVRESPQSDLKFYYERLRLYKTYNLRGN